MEIPHVGVSSKKLGEVADFVHRVAKQVTLPYPDAAAVVMGAYMRQTSIFGDGKLEAHHHPFHFLPSYFSQIEVAVRKKIAVGKRRASAANRPVKPSVEQPVVGELTPVQQAKLASQLACLLGAGEPNKGPARMLALVPPNKDL